MKDRRSLSLVAAAVLTLALAVSPALATHFGNPGPEDTSPDLVTFAGPGTWSCPDGTKIEDPVDGEYDVDFDGFAGSINIDVRNTPNGPVFDFNTNNNSLLVNSVLVKGGPNALLYIYPGDGRRADDGLHAPLNAANGKWYGLSHICFETTKKD